MPLLSNTRLTDASFRRSQSALRERAGSELFQFRGFPEMRPTKQRKR